MADETMSPPADPAIPPPPPPPSADPPPMPGGEPSKDEKMMAMLCHILGIFTCFVGPLIIWLIKKDEMPFVDDQGKESLNFQITVAILYAVLMVVAAVTCGIGALLYPLAMVGVLVFCILAGVKANNGERYRYPVTFRFIK